MSIVSVDKRPYIPGGSTPKSRNPSDILNHIDTAVSGLESLVTKAVQGNYDGLKIASDNIKILIQFATKKDYRTWAWTFAQALNHLEYRQSDLWDVHRDKSLLETPRYKLMADMINKIINDLSGFKEKIAAETSKATDETSPLLGSGQKNMRLRYSQE